MDIQGDEDMPRFTSGFALREDGTNFFLVNTKYYNLEDDMTCFDLSRVYHHKGNITIKNNYEIMRADIRDRYGNGWVAWIDFNDNGKEEFRAYKVIED